MSRSRHQPPHRSRHGARQSLREYYQSHVVATLSESAFSKRTTGFEPATLSLGSLSSAAWLGGNAEVSGIATAGNGSKPLGEGDDWRATGARAGQAQYGLQRWAVRPMCAA